MIRIACAFGLLAVATVILVAVRTDGASAITFSFVGFPALAIASVLYGIVRWRAGAFRSTTSLDPGMGRQELR